MSGGEFTTELGCRVMVVPPEFRDTQYRPDLYALVLRMADPSDLRYAEVLLTDADRAQLKEIL